MPLIGRYLILFVFNCCFVFMALTFVSVYLPFVRDGQEIPNAIPISTLTMTFFYSLGFAVYMQILFLLHLLISRRS